jgi:hypothetical protein
LILVSTAKVAKPRQGHFAIAPLNCAVIASTRIDFAGVEVVLDSALVFFNGFAVVIRIWQVSAILVPEFACKFAAYIFVCSALAIVDTPARAAAASAWLAARRRDLNGDCLRDSGGGSGIANFKRDWLGR